MPAELSVGLREDSKYEAAVAGITSAVTRARIRPQKRRRKRIAVRDSAATVYSER